MPDVLLFGATGYTGRLTAHALARRNADFVIAGRNRSKLEGLAAETGAEVRVAEVGDVAGLVRALDGVRVLITCVGPFTALGATAADAAIEAGVHYVDSTGEISFVERLIARYDARARAAGIVMAPAMGFDEVPSDVALSLAVEGFERPDAVVTYAFPARASRGTLRTIVSGIGTSDARWLRAGRPEHVTTGSRQRWAPMPPPLGPKLGVAVPLAEGALGPLHLELASLQLYATAGRAQAAAMRLGMPLAKSVLGIAPARQMLEKLVEQRADGPSEPSRQRDRWSILAEARSGDTWRNVTLQGADPYGLTAETLATGGMKLARDGHDESGVMAPVQAIGMSALHKELIDFGIDVQVYEPV